MKPINSLPPFKRFCVTIGNLPSSYVDSMSYYECIMWLCKYLKETVIPAVNENAEAVNELINWFNNLDVQDEIDNKLDEMVESGELQEIISEYLNSKAIFGFDTVADMKSATNLIDGSYAHTLGFHSLNDKGGAIYKIRNVTNLDDVNEMNIIALNNEELVAELIELNVNVKTYGAYGNNVHDDTLPIQTCIDRNKKAYIPVGTYLISQLKLNSGDSIVGESADYSKLKSINNNSITTGLIVRKDDNTGWKMYLDKITINGNKDNNSNVFSGIYFKSTITTDLNATIEDTIVEDCTSDGILLENVSETKLINVKSTRNLKSGFYLKTSDCYLTNCCSNHNIERGFYIIHNSNKLVGCKAYFNGYGDNTTMDDLLDGLKRYAGIEIQGGNNNAVIGCELQDNCGAGIFLNYTSRNQIVGNLVESNGLLLDENGEVISYSEAGVSQYIPQVYVLHSSQNNIETSCGNFRYSVIGYTAKWSVYVRDSSNNTIKSSSNNDMNQYYLTGNTQNDIVINGIGINIANVLITPTQERAGIVERLVIEKAGNIVFVNFQLNPDVTIPANDTTLLFSGLPKPLHYLYFSGQNTGNGKQVRLSLGTDGKLSTWYDTSSIEHGNFLNVAFSYISNE